MFYLTLKRCYHLHIRRDDNAYEFEKTARGSGYLAESVCILCRNGHRRATGQKEQSEQQGKHSLKLGSSHNFSSYKILHHREAVHENHRRTRARASRLCSGVACPRCETYPRPHSRKVTHINLAAPMDQGSQRRPLLPLLPRCGYRRSNNRKKSNRDSAVLAAVAISCISAV